MYKSKLFMAIVYFPRLTSQRHSALISSDSQYFQVCFQVLFITWKSLNRADQRWVLNNSEWKLLVYFYCIQNFSKYLNLEAHNSGFQPSLRKEVSNKNLLFHFPTGQRYNTYLNFWVYCNCSSNKTDMVQLLQKHFCVCRGEISRLFQEIWVFAVNLQNFYHFFNTGIPF